jgi:hypothetical protein
MIINPLATIRPSAAGAGVCVPLAMFMLCRQVLFHLDKTPFPIKIEAKNEIE